MHVPYPTGVSRVTDRHSGSVGSVSHPTQSYDCRPQKALAHMEYFVWFLPITLVLASIVFGLLSPVRAGLVGTFLTVVIALSLAPKPLSLGEAFRAICEAVWLAGLVGLVILGGLFFREAVAACHAGRPEPIHMPGSQRSLCFEACFLVGPFMEAVTGYGVGQVAAITMLRGAGLAPLQAAILGLLSQTMVPWGAMANGTMVAAALADLPPVGVGVCSAILTFPLLLGWLAMFWFAAATAGVVAGVAERAEELCWIVGIAALLVACNYLLGPEIAGIAALGSLIALRYCLRDRPSVARIRTAAIACWPYIALVFSLALVRALFDFMPALQGGVSFQPFPNTPPFRLFTHPALWLIVIGSVTVLYSKPEALIQAVALACHRGWPPILTILLFLMMARVTTASGIADAVANAVQQALGSSASLAVPVLAGLFGFLTGSGNAANGLLMQAQISLAREMDISPLWVAAVQNTAAAALTMHSPARVAMGCTIAGVPHLERAVYARTWVFGGVALAILVSISAVLPRT